MSRFVRLVAWTALVALTSGTSSASAQTQARIAAAQSAAQAPGAGRIEGVVKDERGAPVAGAVVSAVGASVGTAETDTQGRFSLSSLQPDAYLVRAHLPGVAS